MAGFNGSSVNFPLQYEIPISTRIVMRKYSKLLTFSFIGLLLAASASGQVNLDVNVLTANYNNGRTNANLNETILSTLNVNSAQFGKLFSLPVTGAINT